MNNQFIKLNKNIILKVNDILFVNGNNYIITRIDVEPEANNTVKDKEIKINKRKFINIYINVLKNKNFIIFNDLIINVKYLFNIKLINNEIRFRWFCQNNNNFFNQFIKYESESTARTIFKMLNKRLEL